MFDYSAPQIVSGGKVGESIKVLVKVKNIGQKDGDEVVQLYLSHEGMEKAPITALKGFKRVYLKAGEEKTLSFEISPKDMSLPDENGVITIFPG